MLFRSPRKCCFRVFGEDKINQFNIQSGEELTVSFDIDAHEYNGRWFNNITAWAVNRNVAQMQAGMPPMGADPMAGQGPMNASMAPFPPAQSAPAEQSADDLPF